jgi:peroxiredoxin
MSVSVCRAQTSAIRGKAPDYAGKEISFYTFTDPVLHQKQELAQTRINPDGTFSLTFHLNKILEIYSDLEKFTGTMVMEPGKEVQITLPPFTPRNAIEAKSPYFQPALYWFGLPQANQDDLNFLVRSFMTDYSNEVVENTSAIYRNFSKETAKAIIDRLEQKYGGHKNEYFHSLRKYFYADLENTVNPGNPGIIIDKYFKKEPVRLVNSAYQKMFRIHFTDFLQKQSQNVKNKTLVTLINSGDFSGLVSYLEKQGYQKEVAELVVIKGLYDGYYSGSFNKDRIIRALNQAQNSITEELSPIVKQIRSKLTKLTIKGKAPFIDLKNLKGETVTLDKYKGKFVYLNFIRSNSTECRAELDSLKSLEVIFRQVLSVLSISTDDNFENAVKLWKTKGYVWDLLNGSKKKSLIENFDAEVVPAFYLIDPEGNLILSPAPPPSHEFEPMFLKLFREYRFSHR